MPRVFFSTLIALAHFAGVPALAEEKTVVVNTFSACGKEETVQQQAEKLCQDFKVAKLFEKDKLIMEAFRQCKAYYAVAVRIQNTYCSYSGEVAAFAAQAAVAARVINSGQIRESQAIVANQNEEAIDINTVYIDKIRDLATRLRAEHTAYIQKLGRLNGEAGNAMLSEGRWCNPENLDSPVPAHLKTLLVASTHGNAQLTMRLMWESIRENLKKLKQVNERAEKNAGIAKLRELESGNVFGESIKQVASPGALPTPPSMVDGFVSGPGIYVFNKAMHTWVPRLPTPAISVIGSGIILTLKFLNGEQINVLDVATSVAMVLSPATGMGIGILRSAYARSDFWVKEYARFSQDELAKDVNLSAFEMMKRWLKVRPYSVQAFTNQCLKKIEFAEKCLPQKQNAKAYDNNPCAGLGAGEKIER